jgi:hypothetical protein
MSERVAAALRRLVQARAHGLVVTLIFAPEGHLKIAQRFIAGLRIARKIYQSRRDG